MKEERKKWRGYIGPKPAELEPCIAVVAPRRSRIGKQLSLRLTSQIADAASGRQGLGGQNNVAFGDLNPFPMRVINAKRVQHMQAVKEQLRKLDEIRNSLPARKTQECGSPVSSDDPSK
ncbi:hypothetical protein HPB50_019000 [Hyalomma asiaticum]|uniref:Uncharacterized protein n=1 Tax=Hyalomma asiaticum TaxID=266040 RepID=A0ACB7T655_HYAAI|nr:hypothetical protein HPB50_019000 [Hyalomma asiaticum]